MAARVTGQVQALPAARPDVELLAVAQDAIDSEVE